MSYPQVDVLIPVYNVAKYIERCLISVFEQQYPNLHVVLVNDASTDNSMFIAQQAIKNKNSFGHSVDLINLPKNEGIGGVRKHLLNNATGKYVLFIDSDDYWDNPLAVKEWVEVAEKGNYSVVVSNYCHEYPLHNNSFEVAVNRIESGKQLSYMMLFGKEEAFLCNKLFKRNELSDLAYLLTRGINMWEDLMLVVPFMYATERVGYYPKVVLHYVHHGDQYTAKAKPQYLTSFGMLFQKLEKHFLQVLPFDVDLTRAMNYAKFRAFFILSTLPYIYYSELRNLSFRIHKDLLPRSVKEHIKWRLYRLTLLPYASCFAYCLIRIFLSINKLNPKKRRFSA